MSGHIEVEHPGEVSVVVYAGGVRLDAELGVPAGARGLVIFAHGSGSSRKSPRNRYVARVLRRGGLATLLMDLLTRDEEAEDERTGQLRFDIGLLASRLAGATAWVAERASVAPLPIGYFGASTGAAAALVAAAAIPERIGAVVSRGGRPDLAGDSLRRVAAPTLLIVGGDDPIVLELNEEALRELACEKELVVVPRATHLFEEPGALEQVAALARSWFERHLHAEARPAHA